MPYVQLKHVNLYFEIYGNEYQLTGESHIRKPTIVVVHGGPGIDHLYSEASFWEHAGDYAQVILIDQRGNGRSVDKSSERWNLKQWATDIHDFCEALSLDKPFIYGCSMGGWVTQYYASLFPDQPGGIILCDTEAFLDIPAIIEAYKKRGGTEIGKIADDFFNHETVEIAEQYFRQCISLCSVNPIPDYWMTRSIQTLEVNQHLKENEVKSMNLLESNKAITAPVLYLSNTINPVHLYQSAKATADAMTHATVEFIALEGAGLVSIDAKEAAHHHIQAFVARCFNEQDKINQ